MTKIERSSLESLIQSEGGTHFSAYLVNRSDAPPIREQLVEALKVASEDIRPIMSREERRKFLKPVEALLGPDKTLSVIRGNIGIFRSKNLFRVLHVPVNVDEFSTVATSFHVKPLLRWIQNEKNFLLALVDSHRVQLFHGTQNSLRHLDTYTPKRKSFRKHISLLQSWMLRSGKRSPQLNIQDALSWLEEKLNTQHSHQSAPLFLAGDPSTLQTIREKLSYQNIRGEGFPTSFKPRDLAKITASIRAQLRGEIEKSYDQSLLEFKYADRLDLVDKNIFKVAKAALGGQVKRLLVAGDVKIFGKFNKKSGALALHAIDIDHEDEDVLDDIAQTVLMKGGEVLVAPRREIPGQNPLLAITEPLNPEFLNKHNPRSNLSFSRLQYGGLQT